MLIADTDRTRRSCFQFFTRCKKTLNGSNGIGASSATVASSNAPPPRGAANSGGSFIDAIKEVLSALSVDTATSTSAILSYSDNATSTKNVDSVQDNFLQQLFSALHYESPSRSVTDNGTDTGSNSSASSVAAAPATTMTAADRSPPPSGSGSGHVPGVGRIEADISKLVQSSTESCRQAEFLMCLERFDEMLSCLDRVLMFAPTHQASLNQRGNVLLHLNRHEEAVLCYDRILAQSAADAAAIFNRGNVLQKMNCLNQALTLQPNFPEVEMA